jgi:hypothetical protein
VCGSWLAARSAVGDAASGTARASATYGRREDDVWAHSAFLCPIPGNPPLYPGYEVACDSQQMPGLQVFPACRAWVRALFGSVRSAVQIRAPRFRKPC